MIKSASLRLSFRFRRLALFNISQYDETQKLLNGFEKALSYDCNLVISWREILNRQTCMALSACELINVTSFVGRFYVGNALHVLRVFCHNIK